MAEFFGIEKGGEFSAPGIRIAVPQDGEDVWMHGKWLGLGPDHAVAVIVKAAEFIRPDGRRLRLGQFPAWVVRGKGKRPAVAAMFNIAQFRGGKVVIDGVETPV